MLISLSALLLLPAGASAWMDAAWPYRRAIDVAWDARNGTGEELATADFYTDGHLRPDGADLRIATADDRPVAARVLMVGPGDRLRVVFSLARGVKRYYAYFGNPDPSPPRAGTADMKPTAGLVMEMRTWPGGPADSAEQLEQAWAKKSPLLGQVVLDSAFLGLNPFGEQQQTIAHMEGTFRAPLDGEYTFAMSADDRAALLIDGKPVLFANSAPDDTRINAKTELKKGAHDLRIYWVNLGGDQRLSIVWRRPDSAAYGLLNQDVLGAVQRGAAGAMEQLQKGLVADFSIDYQGECFFADGYSHRLAFTANAPKSVTASKITYEWDFGDGQTSTSPSVQHLYLVNGIYSVKLTTRIGGNTDTQINRVAVSRDWSHLDKPQEDPLALHARMLAFDDLAKLPPAWLPRAAMLYQRAEQPTPMLTACTLIAAMPKHPDSQAAIRAMQEASDTLLAKGLPEEVVKLWKAVPADSDLQPRAAQELSEVLMWRVGDFVAAARILAPLAAHGDAPLQRLYAQSLLLSQHAAEGERLLRAMPIQGDPNRRAAMSGASARTVEYYIHEGDAEAGEQAWEQWQQRDPADFLEGYAVLLKSKLLEVAKAPVAAAHLAEAFALAMPNSSYSPQLLDRASKLLKQSDPAVSAKLRLLLKQRYPEDPLSQ